MITITRHFALQLRSLLRLMGLQIRSARLSAPVLFLASTEGLHVRVANESIALEYHQPGSLPSAQYTVPMEALIACEGKQQIPVTIDTAPEGRVSFRWDDRGVPVVRLFDDCRERIPTAWPSRPKKFATNDQFLVTALQEAASVINHVPTPRFAVDSVQLQGKTGKIVATDTRQALVIRGDFKFPWDDDVLLVPTEVFGFPDFPATASVEIGATNTHVFVRIGPWTLYLARVTDKRYPDVEGACPSRAGVKTRVQIPIEDRNFLTNSLRRLPANAESDSPVTVDCNGHCAIRAQVRGETPLTELVLSRSQVTGEPVRFVTNRSYLERAFQLGLSQLQIVGPDTPCIFEDDSRTYFWMVLSADRGLGPSADGVRIESATSTAAESPEASSTSPPVSTTPDERSHRMSRIFRRNGNTPHDENPASNGSTDGHTKEATNGHAHAASSSNGAATSLDQTEAGGQEPALLDPIAAAEALQVDLRTALASTGRLLQALRRNRKQARLVETTLQSLRQLQGV